mmetsp:Transcript_26006/g.47550  ORF Transcript_26006/g.47550 Transcript_26006/m.47550 type:complete len:81 (-) Transcript_26006:106-348(-)
MCAYKGDNTGYDDLNNFFQFWICSCIILSYIANHHDLDEKCERMGLLVFICLSLLACFFIERRKRVFVTSVPLTSLFLYI